jgi:WD40 repeat protein
MGDQPTYDVFLSHNSADKAAVEILARRLQEEAGLNPFLDKWHLVPGQPWQEALEAALDHSATVAVILGSSGVSPWHNEEMRAALDGRARNKSLRVIPVLLPGASMPERGEMPRFLSRLTWVDFRNGLDDPEALRRLVSGVRGVAPGPGPEAPPPVGDHPPYRGLEKFRPEDAEWFFGRESETQQLVEKLKTTRFLAVLGPSGSGKSSVVLAGLVPALARDVLPGSAGWPVIIFAPTERPLEELATRLAHLIPGSSGSQLLRDLEADEKTLHLTARQALLDAPDDRRLMLVVDQLEEAFTLCQDVSAREQFFANLLYAADSEGGRAMVVPTMRADFLAKSAEVPALADRLAAFQFLVTPMVESQLREAIQGPAARAGLELEPGLADMILDDVADQPGGLPLLEHALYELWKRRQGRWLSFEAYREIGGVTGALARTADATYQAFDEGQRKIARRILLDLVQPGEGTEDTRRRARWAELVTRPEEAEMVDTVLRCLADQRLVTTGQEEASETAETVVNMAHEALIRNWPRLQGWINQNRESLLIQRRLREAAEEWDQNRRDEGYLYRGARLAAAEEWAAEPEAELTDLERAFLEASRAAVEAAEREKEAQRQRELDQARALAEESEAHRQAEAERAREAEAREREQAKSAASLRKRAVLLAAVGAVAILLAIAAVLFGVQSSQNAERANAESTRALAAEADAKENADIAQQNANNAATAQAKAEQQAKVAFSRQLAVQSGNELDKPNYELALLLAIEAGHTTDTAEAFAALRGAFAHRGRTLLILAGHEAPVWQATRNADGSRILTASSDGTARVWDAQTGEELATLRHEAAVSQATWDADGSRVLTASADGTARVWDANNGKELATLRHEDRVWRATWNADGSRILTVSADGTARVWLLASSSAGDAGSGAELLTLRHEASVRQATWNADESRILTASDDGTARVWDAQTGEELATLRHEASVWQATWNADGSRILTTSWDGTARVWDAGSGAELATLRHEAAVRQATWNADESRILTASNDGTARVWLLASSSAGDAGSGAELLTLRHEDTVWQATWNADESRILTASDDGTARVWDATSGAELATLRHEASVNHATWNADETRILTASWDGTARVWDAGSGAELATLRHEDRVSQATWDTDGSRILTASYDGTARVWDAQSEPELATLRHEDTVYQATWNADGSRILTASYDGTARVWLLASSTAGDAESGEELATLRHEDRVWQATWNADETRILTASADGTARVWDATSGAELAALRHERAVYQATWNADETRILTASADGTARVWLLASSTAGDASSGAELAALRHEGRVYQATWNADETRILTASDDGTARVWLLASSSAGDAESGAELLTLRHEDTVWQATWNADESRILTASSDGTARVWDANNGNELATLRHEDTVNHATWNADGSRILTASNDGTARVWLLASSSAGDAGSGAELLTLRHEDAVWQAAWNADETRILTASYDGTARVWDAQAGEELATLRHADTVYQATWNADETRILTASADGTVKLWYARMEDLLEAACQRAPRKMTRAEWGRYLTGQDYRATCPNLPIE